MKHIIYKGIEMYLVDSNYYFKNLCRTGEKELEERLLSWIGCSNSKSSSNAQHHI